MTYDKETKDEMITSKIAELTRTFTKLDAKTKKAVKDLIANAAFMAVTLEELQQTMNESGVVSEYQNGENQWGTKKSPEVEIYNTMIKNYSGVMKQLTDLLPKATPLLKGDEFDEFVNDR